jgi:hypothetical protein
MRQTREGTRESTMRRVAALGAIVSLGALAYVAPASASYFIGRKAAEHYTRDYWHYQVGYHYTEAECRPQGRATPEPGYIYHRWTCIFRAGDSSQKPSCYGQMLIKGSSDAGSYWSRVLWHGGACPRGTS